MAMGDVELLWVGNAMVDVFVESSDAGDVVLERLGIGQPVQHVEYEKVAAILKELPDYHAGSGGGAANVAKIAALLGVRSGFIGATGRGDSFAGVFSESLAASGVALSLAERDIPTGACIFIQRPPRTANEANRVVASISAAYQLGPDDIDEEAVKSARVVVIDGFILGRDALVHRTLDLASKHGTVVAIDTGSAEIAKSHAAQLLTFCKDYPLILFMNQDEAEALCRALNPDTSEEEPPTLAERLLPPIKGKRPLPQTVQTFLQKLSSDLFPIIAVKLGANGAIVFANGKTHRADTLAITPKDTIGAGDAFCAAFLGAWLRDRPLTECANYGNRTAREVLDVNGTLVDQHKLDHIAKVLRLI
jgi:sugar/nucleoside kinase (ribokinase family)